MLNSYCTVFSGQEVIKTLMNGERIENLIYALYLSVVKRVLEMTGVDTDVVAFSGGVVAHHPMVVQLLESALGRHVIVPPHPQEMGAFGAALVAREGARVESPISTADGGAS